MMNPYCSNGRLARHLSFATVIVGMLGCSGDGRVPLVIYSPHGRDLLTLVERTFEAEHPGIDIRTLDMGSQQALDRIRSEQANPQADIWFGGPSSLFARAVADSLLEPYRPSWANAVEPRGLDGGDFYTSAYETVSVLVYNDSAVSADEAPRDWDDVLDPRWRGKVLIRNPMESGTMRTIFGMIMLRSLRTTGDTTWGVQWLRRLDTQTTDYPLNPALLHQKLLRQEGTITLWDLPDILLQQERGNPFAFNLPSSGTPVIQDAIALVRGTRRPNEAKRFIEWVGSVEAQVLATRTAFRLPARNDIPADSLPDWAREVLASLTPEPMDWDRLSVDGATWMTYWDRNIRGTGVTAGR